MSEVSGISGASFVGVDWGTSSFRLWVMAADGTPLASSRSGEGDFNGDGRTDIGAAWNNNGRITLTVRISQGDRFSHVHWNANAGRWFDSSVFVAGDFDGDGRDEVAQLWNDIG